MSYIKKTMQADEVVGVKAELHWINYFYPFMLEVAAVAVLICRLLPQDFDTSDLIWLVWFFALWGVYEFLKLWCREMAVTNKRVVLRKGIIAIDSDEIKNGKIEGIEVEQPVLGRILNYGNVCFAGVGVGRLIFEAVKNPREVKRRAEEIVGE